LHEGSELVNIFKAHEAGLLLTDYGMKGFVGVLKEIKACKGKLSLDKFEAIKEENENKVEKSDDQESADYSESVDLSATEN